MPLSIILYIDVVGGAAILNDIQIQNLLGFFECRHIPPVPCDESVLHLVKIALG